MSRISGACVLVTALASAFGFSHQSEARTRHYVDGALGDIAGNMERLNVSLDKVIRLLEERPAATIDLHGQEQSMIVVMPMTKDEADAKAVRDILTARGLLPNGLPADYSTDRGGER